LHAHDGHVAATNVTVGYGRRGESGDIGIPAEPRLDLRAEIAGMWVAHCHVPVPAGHDWVIYHLGQAGSEYQRDHDRGEPQPLPREAETPAGGRGAVNV
jgi:hypothetical protein